ncbi:MAG: tetratricopeptide repeat protein [Pseudomonadota bacterium]
MNVFALAPNPSKTFLHTAAFSVFTVLFLFYLSPIGLGDVYWHLNTGRWIWEHGALPDSDPFTYTQAGSLDAQPGLHFQDYWQSLILQGYWLAQLLFFAVYVAFGPWGLVVLKAVLFVTLYWLVWRAMLKARVEPLLGLLAILLLPWLLYRYDELRPHIFSFIGVVLVYMNINSALAKLRSGVAQPGELIMLPLVMLLWANLHPGFILGWVVIVVMLAGAAFDRWRGIHALERPALRRLLIWCGIALLASLANPLGYAFITNMGALQEQYSLGVDEFLALAEYARVYQQPVLFYGVLAIALASLGVLILRRKQTDPAQAFLFIGFAAAGFSAFRYTIFFLLIALMIGMPHVSALSERYIGRARPLLIALLLVAMSGVGYLTFQHAAWKQGAVQTNYVPERAVEWIHSQHPPAPLFNAYEYGGYLGWRLAPEYRMFIDPRCLDFAVFNDYQTARGGSYRGVFEKYGVNSVVFYLFTPLVNSIPEVTLYLLMDKRWDLVFVDRLSVVLVRNEVNKMPVIDKAPLLDYLQQVLERTLEITPEDTQALVQYGRVLLYRGDVTGAQQHFNTALQINPQLRAPRLYLEAIGRQKK